MSSIIVKIFEFLSGDVGTIVCLSILIASFIYLLVLSVLKRAHIKEKLYFFIFGFSLSLVYLATSLMFKTLPYIAFFVLGASGMFLSILLFIDGNKDCSARELIEKIDSEIQKEENTLCRAESEIPIIEKRQVEVKNQQKRELDVDFAHVKSILERLDYYALSNQDKRAVCELEGYLAQAERGDNRKEIKEQINDGLSNLLKIMAKYGV